MDGKGKKVNRSRRARRRQVDVPDALTTYRGPVITGLDREELDHTITLLSWTGKITSSIGGIVQTVLSNDPSNSTDFAKFVDTYDEYRVLATKLEFLPFNRYSKVSTTCTPAIWVIDRVDQAGISSYSNAMNYSSAEKKSLEDPWTMTAKMSGIEDAGFVNTASTVTTWCYKCYADGLSNSTDYGRYFLYARVQFRGRK